MTEPITEPRPVWATVPAAPAHRRVRRYAVAVIALSLGLQACGGAPPVEVDAAPAGAPTGTPTEVDTVPVGAERERGPRPERAIPPPPDATEEPEAQEPSSGGSQESPPRSDPPPPDLVVGEDGCVTDRTTGLVVTCHDDAAGPDEPTTP
ncbi:MAG: hypothetical protein WEB03_09390 [Nitriliruptor sp.]|uniref:hypothetical protein n=1 Tax=Nitriliruptor sp. TaxID=2448056 RepID=UPI0034A03AB9